MNKPKDRGRFVENWIRDKHIENGIACERVPLSGSIGGAYDGDLAIPSIANKEFTCESKARRNGEGFKVLEDWMKGKDILFIKRNHRDPLVVLPFSLYLRFLRKYYGKDR
jgi:hypothetical protein